MTGKIRNNNSLVVPLGQHFINRMLQPTDKTRTVRGKVPEGQNVGRKYVFRIQQNPVRDDMLIISHSIPTGFRRLDKIQFSTNILSRWDKSNVPQGQHFINRMLQPTDRQSTLCYEVPQGRHNPSLVRKLKHTVNKVSSHAGLRYTLHFLSVS